MLKKYLDIKNIPSLLWGDDSQKLFVVVHGNMSNKEDAFIRIFAEEAVSKGYQVLSFDLPEHGQRKDNKYLCSVQNCVSDLEIIMEYARSLSKNISLLACSMGAYFSLLAYKNNDLNQSIFLSPVVDMEKIIAGMMTYFEITEDKFKLEKEIHLPNGQVLYWDYYQYVKSNPINKWDIKTAILYGENDNLVKLEDLLLFSKKFDCRVNVMKGAEHYFHTDEQLEFFRNWAVELI